MHCSGGGRKTMRSCTCNLIDVHIWPDISCFGKCPSRMRRALGSKDRWCETQSGLKKWHSGPKS